MFVQKVIGIRDIDLSFNPNPVNKDLMVKTDVNALKNSIVNLAFLDQFDLYSIVLKKSIANMIFENTASYTVKLELESVIKDLINRLEPRCKVTNIVINTENDNEFKVEIQFIAVFDRSEHKVTFVVSTV